MGRALILFACIFFLFSSFLYAQMKTPLKDAETFPFLAEVIKEKVSVRAGESENFEKLDVLKKGDHVLVLGKNYSWYKIQLPVTAKSFIIDKYITLLQDGLSEVNADRVNVRAGADVNRTVLGQLAKGAKVRILEKLDGWYRIEPLKESCGWVADEFLKQIPMTEVKMESQPSITTSEANEKKISAIGILNATEDNSGENQYQLIVDGKTAYIIEGFEHVLNEFLHSTVQIEGKAAEEAQNKDFPPVIRISKIQLVL